MSSFSVYAFAGECPALKERKNVSPQLRWDGAAAPLVVAVTAETRPSVCSRVDQEGGGGGDAEGCREGRRGIEAH